MSNEALFIFFRNMTIVLATVMLVKYFAFLMLAAWFPVREQLRRIRVLRAEKKKYGKVRDYTPLVSVIVPAWNEEVGIMRTINSGKHVQKYRNCGGERWLNRRFEHYR
jgi:cellulose synthase/poly-beta-1,6-N-acetylglucosamine synthase-like glycosyltransferase